MTTPTLECSLYLSRKLTPQRAQVAEIVHSALLQQPSDVELSAGDILAIISAEDLERYRAGETQATFYLTLEQVRFAIDDLYAAGEIDLTVGLAEPHVTLGQSCDAYMRRELARKEYEAFMTLAPKRWPMTDIVGRIKPLSDEPGWEGF